MPFRLDEVDDSQAQPLRLDQVPAAPDEPRRLDQLTGQETPENRAATQQLQGSIDGVIAGGSPEGIDLAPAARRAIAGQNVPIPMQPTAAEYQQRHTAEDEADNQQLRDRYAREHPGKNPPVSLAASDGLQRRANLSGVLETLRNKIDGAAGAPIAQKMSDGDVLEWHRRVTEQEATDTLLHVGRETLGQVGANLPDAAVLNLVRMYPQSYQPALQKIAGAKAADEAAGNLESRALLGTGDNNPLLSDPYAFGLSGIPMDPDHAAIAAQKQYVQQQAANTRVGYVGPKLGALENWADAWSFGLLGLASKAGVDGGNIAGVEDAYQKASPNGALLSKLLGYATPYGPAAAAGNLIGAAAGSAVNKGVQGALGPSAAGAADALANPLLARIAGGAAQGAVDMPLISSAGAYLESGGNLQAPIDQLRPDHKALWLNMLHGAGFNAVFGAVGEVVRAAPAGVANLKDRVEFGRTVDQAMADIGVSAFNRESVIRLAKMKDAVDKGMGVEEAARYARVTPADLIEGFRIQRETQRAAGAGAGGNAPGSNAGAPPTPPPQPPTDAAGVAPEPGEPPALPPGGGRPTEGDRGRIKDAGNKLTETLREQTGQDELTRTLGEIQEAGKQIDAQVAKHKEVEDALTPKGNEPTAPTRVSEPKTESDQTRPPAEVVKTKPALEVSSQEEGDVGGATWAGITRSIDETHIRTLNDELDRLKAANDPAADHVAAELQMRLHEYEIQHGEDAAQELYDALSKPPAAVEKGKAIEAGSVKPSHPAELADAAAVGRWYAQTFNDAAGAPAIEGMASLGRGKYVLSDVPLSAVSRNHSRDGMVEANITGISKLSPPEVAELPPAILVGRGGGKLEIADGRHRVEGLADAGFAYVRAYVPEEFVGKNGVQAAAASATTSAPDGGQLTKGAPHGDEAIREQGRGEPGERRPEQRKPGQRRQPRTGRGGEQVHDEEDVGQGRRGESADAELTPKSGGGEPVQPPRPPGDGEGLSTVPGYKYRPYELQKGDIVEGYGDRFEIVVPDKRGMAKLKNLRTGELEDFNAYNNFFAVVGGPRMPEQPSGGTLDSGGTDGRDTPTPTTPAAQGTEGAQGEARPRDAGGERVLPGEAPVSGGTGSGATAPAAEGGAGRGGIGEAPAPAPSEGHDESGGAGRRRPRRGGQGAEGGGGGEGDGGADRADRRRPAKAPAPPGEGAEGSSGDVQEATARREGDVPQPADAAALNHRIAEGDTLAPAGEITKARANIKAIELLKALEQQGQNPTAEEKRTLAQYVGWGSIPNVFDEARAEFLDERYQQYKRRLPDDQFKAQENWERKYGELYTRVKLLLTPEEWKAARASTINAHYTSREVIEGGLWGAVKQLGFRGGKALENSAGVGHVMGLAPGNKKIAWTAVELDSLSSRILEKLYPQAAVYKSTGFEKAPIPKNSQDLVIGNVPFAKDGPRDPDYPRFSLHNYFLAKSIEVTKPGGLIVEITSSSTMDNGASRTFREWAASRVDLVGAIRLPNNAFAKNAGTEVTTDILILRKKDATAFALGHPWLNAADVPALEEGKKVSINEYFVAHPEMMLGQMSTAGEMYGRGDEQTLQAFDDGPALPERLQAAVKKLPADIASHDAIAEAQAALVGGGMADQGQKEFSYQTDDEGRVWQVINRQLQQPEWAKGLTGRAAKLERAKAWIPLREAAKRAVLSQLDPAAGDEAIADTRAALNKVYDSFFGKFGRVNANPNRFLADDPEYGITASLEYIENDVQQQGGTKVYVEVMRKAPIFERRTIHPIAPPERAETLDDAFRISKNWRGVVDPEYIARLTGKGQDAVKQEAVARGLAFINPATGLLEEPDEYLSGNVRKKLRDAQAAATADPELQRNAEALAKVQPKPIGVHEIEFRLGSSWIPPVVVEDWLKSVFGGYRLNVHYVPQTGTWVVDWGGVKADAKNTSTLAGGGIAAHALIEDALNLRPTIAYDSVRGDDGKPRQVKNADRTEAAQAKVQELRDMFETWARASGHKALLEETYNEEFNSHLIRNWQPPVGVERYPNASDAFTPRTHQKAAVTRGLSESYILAHGVGVGKTLTIVHTVAEAKRLGLAKKPLVVVQNATLGQIVETYKRVYPWATVLAPTKADFESKNRQRLLSRIATGAFDAIIVPHSQFDMIPDSPERVRAYIQAEVDELEEARTDAARAEGKGSPRVKELVKAIKRLEEKLAELADRATDDGLTFEQLGVDLLVVDEAHRYKKVQFATKVENIKGLDKGASERGLSMLMKARHIQEKTGGRGVILSTGTPVTNTLAEVWNMVRLVRPDLLREFNVTKFDDFFSTFTQSVTQTEYTDVGEWKQVTRLAKFTNGPELLKLWRSAADVKGIDDVDEIKRPGLKNGEPTVVTVAQGPAVSKIMAELLARYKAWNALTGKEKREQSHIPLLINGLAKKAALEVRLVDPRLKPDPEGKLPTAIAKIAAIYKATTPTKAAQLIFADLYQSSDGSFNVYNALRDGLVEAGIPREEIAVIGEHDSDKKRAVLFDKVNAGEVRVLVGSTERLGIGVNVQRRLIALHHLDAPWRPSDMEQREGRILRQGNENAEVEIFRYGVKQTLDAGMFSRLATKQRFINQVIAGRIEGRNFEDFNTEVVANFNEAFAEFTGDPLAMEKVTAEAKYKRLQAQARQHEQAVYDARYEIENIDRRRPEVEQRLELLKAVHGDYLAKLAAEPLSIEAYGRKAAGDDATKLLGELLDRLLDEVAEHGKEQFAKQNLSKRGYSLQPERITVNGVPVLLVPTQPADVHTAVPIGEPFLHYAILPPGGRDWIDGVRFGEVKTAKGLISTLPRQVESLDDDIRQRTAQLEKMARDRRELEGFIKKPFDKKQDLIDAATKYAEIMKELERRAAEAAKHDEAVPETDIDSPEEGGALMSPVAAMQALYGPAKKGKAPPSPRIDVAPLPGGSGKPLHQIISDFADALGHRLHVARGERNSGGMYYPPSLRTSIRYAGDLNTVAHELAGHFIDDKFGLLKRWYLKRVKSPYDKELIPHFSAHGSVTKSGPKSRLRYRRAEGVAEWIRAYVVNPDAAKAAAPKFSAYFLRTIDKPTLAALEAFGKDVREWAGLSHQTRTATNINAPKKKGAVRRIVDAFLAIPDAVKFEFGDDLAPIHEAAGEALKLRADLPAIPYRKDPSLLLSLLAGGQGKVADVIKRGVPVAFTNGTLAPGVGGGVKWLLEPLGGKGAKLGERLTDALAYLVNRRVVYKAKQFRQDAQDRIDELKKAGLLTPKREQKILDAVEARVARLAGTGGGVFSDEQQAKAALLDVLNDPVRQARNEKFAQRYEAWGKGLLKYLLDTGRLSQKSYDRIVERNEVYADLHRLAEEAAPALYRPGRKIGSGKEPIKTFKGSTRTIESPLVNLLKQTAAVLYEADRNNVLQQFADLLTQTRDLYGDNRLDLDSIGSRAKEGDRDTIKIYVKGEPQYWQFRPDVFDAMKRIGQTPELGPVLRAVSMLVKGISHNLITKSTAFAIRQLTLKDPLQRAVLSRVGSNPLSSFKRFGKDTDRAFMLAGGEIIPEGVKEWHELIDAELHKLAGDKGTVLTTAANLLRGTSGALRYASDKATRLAEFEAAYEKAIGEGHDPYDAALYAAGQARDLIDYAVAGRTVRRLSPFVLFLNPAIKGPVRAWRGLLEDVHTLRDNPSRFARQWRKSVIGRWALYILLPRLLFAALRYLLGQEDEYDQLPAWRKDFLLNVKVGGVWLSLPQPYELGVLGAGVERVLLAARGRKHAMEGYVGSQARALLPTDELVIGGAFKAMIEGLANYSFFFNRYIVPPDQEKKDLSLRDTVAASRMGQALQALVGIDARKIDNFLYQMGGGTFNTAKALSDLGRKDRSPMELLHATVGLSTDTPAFTARDVQWVMSESSRIGDDESKQMKELRRLLRAQREAEGLKAKNEAAKELREYATQLREYYEQNGEAILNKNKDRADARKAG